MKENNDKLSANASTELIKAATSVANIVFEGFPLKFNFLIHREGKSLEDEKSDLVSKLLAAGIDPLVFDVLLSNEIDRRLKTRFGITFIILTSLFTAASYFIVVANGLMELKISDTAITGLIIETPFQFVGLLYIIARNLFPDGRQKVPNLRNGK